ncbi:hypothetical protein [Marinobacter shengliensis]|uniref:hypothetical protein n=1 Tax=Marinobacter shengliensis TaxID=1389223 RepID=UPI001109FF7B|nr:hypothetical protein [Marinobacter shengliensis]
MTRLVDVAGRPVVAGLSWINYAGSTSKGVDAKERSFAFNAVAYLKGKDPASTERKSDSKILAAGYASEEALLEDVDAPDLAQLLNKPSLMLWLIEQAKVNGMAEGGVVNGIFKVDLGEGNYWIGAVSRSKPLPFDLSDTLVSEGQVESILRSLSVEVAESEISLSLVEVIAQDFFSGKPGKSVGRLVKGRSSLGSTLGKLAVIGVAGAIFFLMLGKYLEKDTRDLAPGPSDAELRNEAISSYGEAMQRDFGWTNSQEAYELAMETIENAPTAVEQWVFIGAACSAQSGNCIVNYESPGYGTPSVLEAELGASIEASLGGRNALYRQPIDFQKSVPDQFKPPSSNEVRSALLDTAAFLRSPALNLRVEILKPEQVAIENGSFLRGSTFSAEYMKGGLSVSGSLGLIDVAAHQLNVPGVVITEVLINNDEFVLRGHYAFN